jgi:hypothetical protein
VIKILLTVPDPAATMTTTHPVTNDSEFSDARLLPPIPRRQMHHPRRFFDTYTWPSMPICAPRPAPSVTYVPTSRIAAIRGSIYAALFARSYFHDFDSARIPGHDQSPVIHDRMHDLRFQREAASPICC